jgi:HD-GYP domain-containing protein (c-di-GMP phosphodiesterase class II)
LDIGKIKIPDSVLKKPGKLDRDEWNIMKSHPTQGRIILEESNSPILLEASAIVEQHHERN